jgi:DNA-binding protein YbaB
VASDPEELLAALDDAEVIGTVTDALGDVVKVGVIGGAVLIGVSGSPAILEEAKQEEFAQLYVAACHQAKVNAAQPDLIGIPDGL